MNCEVSIDWLTFTIQTDDTESVIRDWLGLDPDLFQVTGFSMMGYSEVRLFSDIRVMSKGLENQYFHNMGVCVSMSGNGCRSFETFSKLSIPGKQASSPFTVLLSRIDSDKNAHVSRIDIACDDKSGTLDMETIIHQVEENGINSRLAKRRVVYDLDGKRYNGSTVYVGSPSSEFRLRIYDKAVYGNLKVGQCAHRKVGHF